jgi:hypothetical protein
MSLIKRMAGSQPALDPDSPADTSNGTNNGANEANAASKPTTEPAYPGVKDAAHSTEVMLGPGTSPLPRNTVLQSRYDIEQVLGIGGMSTVYKARDLRFSAVARYCAIKEMPDTSPDLRTGQIRLANFEREASLLATLSHPGIPKIYDFFSSNGRVYLVLEYIDGKDLESQLELKGGPMM